MQPRLTATPPAVWREYSEVTSASESNQIDVRRAADEFRWRTLSKIPHLLDRLIYLASMRDYNTGLYYHDGLAAQFSEDVACETLAGCHREVFRQLLICPLREIVDQLEEYIRSTGTTPADFVSLWSRIEPYRVTVPVSSDPLAADLLFSNLKVALAIVGARQLSSPRSGARQDALPQPSPAR